MRMGAFGDGPVVLGLYDSADQSSSVYEFTVRQGDSIEATSFTRPPQHNDEALVPAFQEGGAGRSPSVLWIGGGILLVVLLVGLVAWRRPRRISSAETKGQAAQPIAAGRPGQTCPRCGTVQTGQFCNRCGAPLGGAPAAARLCPKCGQQVDPEARFCASCGTKIGPS
ncbi:MAG: zinc ribbon domain-containing protein [Chloroflexia bacterium]|nr:zinc ribbon domain-containing protein [Chloroflexia bacterium]